MCKKIRLYFVKAKKVVTGIFGSGNFLMGGLGVAWKGSTVYASPVFRVCLPYMSYSELIPCSMPVLPSEQKHNHDRSS